MDNDELFPTKWHNESIEATNINNNLYLTNYIKGTTIDAEDLSYIQGQLMVLYPNEQWLTVGSVSNLQSIALFKLLLSEKFTKRELRKALNKYSKTKTYSNFFKLQDFMELAMKCKYKIYTVKEYNKLKDLDDNFVSTNNTRYYLNAGDYLFNVPNEVYGISGLPIPKASDYNTYYKVEIEGKAHKVMGRDGLSGFVISTFSNYLGCYRAPVRYYE